MYQGEKTVQRPFMLDLNQIPRPTPRSPRATGEAFKTGALLLCITENAFVSNREIAPALKAAGFEVELVEAGSAKSIDLTARPYALVVLDILRPDGTGFALCQQIHDRSTLPVVLILHGAARNEVLRGYALGADAYVLAPFDREELVARLNALLRRQPAWRWQTVA
jgi:DNA-binding response OmpR family regulator